MTNMRSPFSIRVYFVLLLAAWTVSGALSKTRWSPHMRDWNAVYGHAKKTASLSDVPSAPTPILSSSDATQNASFVETKHTEQKAGRNIIPVVSPSKKAHQHVVPTSLLSTSSTSTSSQTSSSASSEKQSDNDGWFVSDNAKKEISQNPGEESRVSSPTSKASITDTSSKLAATSGMTAAEILASRTHSFQNQYDRLQTELDRAINSNSKKSSISDEASSASSYLAKSMSSTSSSASQMSTAGASLSSAPSWFHYMPPWWMKPSDSMPKAEAWVKDDPQYAGLMNPKPGHIPVFLPSEAGLGQVALEVDEKVIKSSQTQPSEADTVESIFLQIGEATVSRASMYHHLADKTHTGTSENQQLPSYGYLLEHLHDKLFEPAKPDVEHAPSSFLSLSSASYTTSHASPSIPLVNSADDLEADPMANIIADWDFSYLKGVGPRKKQEDSEETKATLLQTENKATSGTPPSSATTLSPAPPQVGHGQKIDTPTMRFVQSSSQAHSQSRSKSKNKSKSASRSRLSSKASRYWQAHPQYHPTHRSASFIQHNQRRHQQLRNPQVHHSAEDWYTHRRSKAQLDATTRLFAHLERKADQDKYPLQEGLHAKYIPPHPHVTLPQSANYEQGYEMNPATPKFIDNFQKATGHMPSPIDNPQVDREMTKWRIKQEEAQLRQKVAAEKKAQAEAFLRQEVASKQQDQWLHTQQTSQTKQTGSSWLQRAANPRVDPNFRPAVTHSQQ